ANTSRNSDTRSKGITRCPFGIIGGSTSCARGLTLTRRTPASPLRGDSRDKFQRATGAFTGAGLEGRGPRSLTAPAARPGPGRGYRAGRYGAAKAQRADLLNSLVNRFASFI